MSVVWPLLIASVTMVVMIGALAIAPKQSVELLHPKE